MNVGIFGKVSDLSKCMINYSLGAIAETAVTADASAAVRVIVIEGGVFISG